MYSSKNSSTEFLKQKKQDKGTVYIEVNGAILNRVTIGVFFKDVNTWAGSSRVWGELRNGCSKERDSKYKGLEIEENLINEEKARKPS